MGLSRRHFDQSGPGSAGPPVPARLRMLDSRGNGKWLHGALRLSPGSLLWVPDRASSSPAVELVAATLAVDPGQFGVGPMTTPIDLDTPFGRVQLELTAELFQMSQELVTGTPGDWPDS
jgi:hypothetical protein